MTINAENPKLMENSLAIIPERIKILRPINNVPATILVGLTLFIVFPIVASSLVDVNKSFRLNMMLNYDQPNVAFTCGL